LAPRGIIGQRRFDRLEDALDRQIAHAAVML
jgi:hypothetical protein